jgi:hypothetical protein
MMMEASTMAPIATAMPPRDMMLAVRPWADIGMNERTTAIGRVRMGTERAPEMEEEEDDHQAHDHHLLDQRALERADGPMDQLGSVVGRHEVDARWEGTPDLFQPFLHAVDHVERVLLLPHDHDPADDLALSVQLGDAAARLRSEVDLTELLYGDRHASLATFTTIARRSSSDRM